MPDLLWSLDIKYCTTNITRTSTRAVVLVWASAFLEINVVFSLVWLKVEMGQISLRIACFVYVLLQSFTLIWPFCHMFLAVCQIVSNMFLLMLHHMYNWIFLHREIYLIYFRHEKYKYSLYIIHCKDYEEQQGKVQNGDWFSLDAQIGLHVHWPQ